MKCFGFENGKVVVKNPSKCISCHACEIQCPQQCINVKD